MGAVKEIDETMSIVAGDTSQMALAAREIGINVIREAFVDRRYMPDGSLSAGTIPMRCRRSMTPASRRTA